MPPKRQVHWWTTQERHVVFILYTEYEQTNEECSQLFCHHFGHLFPTPPDAGRIRDEFASRDEPTRSKMWERQIERINYTEQQEAQRTEARRLIQVAAQTLGITLRPVANGAPSAHPAPAPAAAPMPPTTAGNIINNTSDDSDDSSSELSSPPVSSTIISATEPVANKYEASPNAQPVPETQGTAADGEDGPDASRNNRKRATADDDEEMDDGPGGENTNTGTDEVDEEATPRPALSSRSGLVRTPVPTTKSKKIRPTNKKTPSAKKQRATRQTVREEDKNRNARPGFPEKYGHVYRNELPPNSRLLKILDRHHAMNFWKDKVVGEGAGAETVEETVGDVGVDGVKEMPVQRTPLLRQKSDEAAHTLLARVRAAQIDNGIITQNQPIRIFTPAAAATLAAAEEDPDQDQDVVMGDDE
ncbi:hypothetical protein PRZ48_008879 [Zasmidium cellare]|uniref:Uncharacterized protein n=1 Tax=Zasmidium cellare TaxID=395010 RepID=A0ABR0EGS8_ZASCE|nr:hypothetical protein PRZ48_008879 [Zasmidium cellare]